MEYALNPVDNTRIAYRSTGVGPPVLLIHGTALSQVIWRGFGYVRDLAADHTVVTLDLRGHGRSDKPRDQTAYRMDLLVADVLAVLDSLALTQVHLVGYSLGGRLGFSLAQTYPDRLLSLVSLGGAARNLPGSFDRLFFPGCIDVLAAGDMTSFIEGWEAHMGKELDPSTRAAFLANDSDALAAYAREAEQDPGVPNSALGAISLPALLVAGSKDTERLSASEEAVQTLPHAQLKVLDGASHGNTLTHPDARTVVREFLAAQLGVH